MPQTVTEPAKINQAKIILVVSFIFINILVYKTLILIIIAHKRVTFYSLPSTVLNLLASLNGSYIMPDRYLKKK